MNVPDSASNTIFTVPIAATVPANAQLVMEVFTPDGTVAGNLLFMGSNADPESAPSYLSAAACGITTPTTTAAIGFPNMHLVFNVNGNCGGTTPTPTPTATVSPTTTPSPTATPTATTSDAERRRPTADSHTDSHTEPDARQSFRHRHRQPTIAADTPTPTPTSDAGDQGGQPLDPDASADRATELASAGSSSQETRPSRCCCGPSDHR